MWNDVQKRIDRAINKARNGILGLISSTIKGSSEVYIKISDSDELRDVKITAPYGFHSLPTPGIFGQVIYNNSSKKASLIGVEDRGSKPVEIDIGEVLVYNTNSKSYIVFKNNGSIDINGSGASISIGSDGSVSINSPETISIDAPMGISLSATSKEGSGVTINGKNSSGSW